MRLVGILASGQTGTARGALDVALARDIRAGGWWPRVLCPEDGSMPARYAFLGRHGKTWESCHVRMLLEAQASVIFEARRRRGGRDALRSGAVHAAASGKPFAIVPLYVGEELARLRLCRWFTQLRAAIDSHPSLRRRYAELTLFVRGPSESRAPGIAEDVRVVLGDAIDDSEILMPTKQTKRRSNFDDYEALTGAKHGQLRHKQTGQLFFLRRRNNGFRGTPQPYSCAAKGCKNPVIHREMKGMFWKNGCAEHRVLPDVQLDEALPATG